MNKLAFNPSKDLIEEWEEIYFSESVIDNFQTIINKTHMYLQNITNYKQKLKKGKAKRLKSKKSLCSNMDQNDEDGIASQIKYFQSDNSGTSIERINGCIGLIHELQERIKSQYEAARKKNNSDNINKTNQSQQIMTTFDNNIINSNNYDVCQSHLQTITIQSFKFYNAFLSQEYKVIQAFIIMKFSEIQPTIQQIRTFFSHFTQKNQQFASLKMIYQNLFIETEYLRNFIHRNKNIFETHSHEQEYSSGYQQINQIRQKYINELGIYCQQIEQMKKKLRVMYVVYINKSSKKNYNHERLDNIICSALRVNSQQYQNNNTNVSFLNGFAFAFLFCALISIIVFRQLNITQLEQDTNYLRQFKIWRGASYLICFNWILGVVFWFFDKFRINYRMILIEDDLFLPSPQTFFLNASILSAIYLTLFLVYLLHQIGIIVGASILKNLGYFMWGVNLVYLLNPFKILNYEGRRYFLTLLWKFMMSLFRPMNMNIFFVAIIIGSFVQPFGDFAFTFCQAVYRQERDCVQETHVATFVFTMVFLFYRFVQSIRSHIQFGDRCYSRPLIGITAVLFSMNTVITSYFYNANPSNDSLFHYWLVSAAFSTIAGIQADLRADWGLISFDEEDCILRKHKYFPRATYFIVSAIDIVLNIGWVLTISNNTANDIGINAVYFLMILSYVELARKGMWIFFRIEEDHSVNRANLVAVLDDSNIYDSLSEIMVKNDTSKPVNKQKKQDKSSINERLPSNTSTSNQKKYVQFKVTCLEQSDINNIKLRQSKLNISNFTSKLDQQQTKKTKLTDIQRMIANKKQINAPLKQLIDQLKDYLRNIHLIYNDLDWDEQE